MRLSVALKGATSSGSGAAVTAAEEETGGGGAASATESTAGVANVESASAAAAEGAPATVSDEAEAAALCELCAADLIMCSPLTRALQTCVLALGGVLKERAQPIYLAPNARERINPGSADSFGCAIGATEVHERLLAKTADLVHGENDIVTPSGAAKAILDGTSHATCLLPLATCCALPIPPSLGDTWQASASMISRCVAGGGRLAPRRPRGRRACSSASAISSIRSSTRPPRRSSSSATHTSSESCCVHSSTPALRSASRPSRPSSRAESCPTAASRA